MNVRRFVISCAAAAALTLGSAAPSAAQSLPSAVLTAPDGTSVNLVASAPSGRWLLVYLAPGSAPSDQLLQRLGETWTEERATRILFILAGSVEEAKAHLAAKGGDALAASAKWLVDSERAVWESLGFQGTLAVAGVLDARIDWKLDGVINDPGVLQSLVEAWIGGN